MVFSARGRYSFSWAWPASRIRLCAETELPDGTAVSTISLPRARSASWSLDVKKNPPPASSANSSICFCVRSARGRSPPVVAVGGVQAHQAVGQEGVVVQVGIEPGLAGRKGAQEPARAPRSFVSAKSAAFSAAAI